MKKNKSSAAMLLAKRKDKKTNLIQSCNTKYGTLRQYVSAHTQFAVLCADTDWGGIQFGCWSRAEH